MYVKKWSAHCDMALQRRGWKPSVATDPLAMERYCATVAKLNIVQGKDDSSVVSSKIDVDMPCTAGHQEAVQL